MTEVFAAFGLASQAILVSYFAARRWRPAVAERLGWIAYLFGCLGLGVGAWLAIGGASYQLFLGPFLLAAWAVLGGWADLLARIEWRQPILWQIFLPYLALYLAAQMFLWWPLWGVMPIAWGIYAALFVANTALNLRGHPRPASGPVAPGPA